MFENKIIDGVHATRYIASWAKMGGDFGHKSKGRFDFYDWLKSLNLTDDEVDYIYNLATNGRMELEYSAKNFMSTLND
jgi:hypothetical protein